MSVIKRMRKQEAIYWERNIVDSYGKFSYLSPIEVKCRWDDAAQEYRNSLGEKAMSQSIVYPDRVMKTGDMLKRGTLESTTLEDPTAETDVFEIQRFDQIPNFKATETLFIAYL